jgi:hypothetical protein
VEDVFRYATTPQAAAEFFVGFGPIRAIRRVRYQPGSELRAGGRRIVEFVDASTLEEEVVELDPPRRHRYRVGGFTPPVAWLIREAEACWDFISGPRRTDIRWKYNFTLASPIAWPLAAVLVKLFMRVAMLRALRRIARHCAAAGP